MSKLPCAIVFALATVAPSFAQCSSPSCHLLTTGVVHDGQGGPFLSGHVYVLGGVHTVPAGETLTIQPGAIVKFPSTGFLPFPLNVLGNLQAVGTATQPIVITSGRDDFGGDTDGQSLPPAPGDWKGIQFAGGSGSGMPNVLDYCIVAYGGAANVPVLDVNTPDFVLTNSVVTSCSGPALDLHRITPTLIAGSLFDSCQRPARDVPMDAMAAFAGNFATNNTATDEISLTFNGSSLNLAGAHVWSPVSTMNGSGVVIMEVPPQILSGASLTLAAGMIVKWMHPTFGMNVSGTLTCNGTAAKPVVFAHVDEDLFGGDTLKDGPAALGPGAWRSLSFGPNSDASVLDWVVLSDPGGSGAFGAVELSGADVTITNTAVVGSATAAVQMTSSAPTIDSCVFVNGQTAVDGATVAGLGSITNNFAAGNAGGDYVSIGGGTVVGSATIGPANALSTPTGPGALVLGGSLSVYAGATLTLLPGTVIKSNGPWTVSVDGILDSQGTPAAPVVFTSFDDDYGGDTNNSATPPAPGDWEGLSFSATALGSTLDNVLVRYGGGGAAMAAVAMNAVDATVHMTDCTVESSSTAGLTLFGIGTPTVTGCAFDNNQQAVVRVPFAAIAGITACTATGNALGDYMDLAGGSIGGQVVFDPANTLNGTGVFVLSGALAITAGGRLELTPNTVVKVDGNHMITVDGELACPTGPAWITSLADDVGGDTNNAPTPPSPGDWDGIRLQNSFVLENVTVRYAGSNGTPSVLLNGPATGLDGVTVEFGGGAAVSIGAPAPVTNCAFNSCDRPTETIPLSGLAVFTNNTASGNTQGDLTRINDGGGGGIFTIGPANSLNGNGTFIVESNIVLPSNSILTLLAGTVFKFSSAALVQVTTQLVVSGTASSPVVLTTVNDDAYGADANGNGPAPQPGEWVGLSFSSVSDMSVIDGAVIRYAGAGGPPAPAVDLQLADVTICNTTIEKCAGTALHANSNSSPTIKNCVFTCNGGKALDGITWGVLGKTSGLSASGNAGGDATVIDNSVVSGHLKIRHDSYLGDAIIVNVSPVVDLSFPPVNSLSFGEGVIIKCGNPSVDFRLNSESSICGTNALPVIMTSIHDDTIAGDTNMNGAATSPAPGDWGGVWGEGMNGISYLLHRYGGNGTYGIRGAMAPVVSTRVEYCDGPSAFYVNGQQENCIAFANSGDGFNGGALEYCTAAYNGGTGMEHGFGVSASVRGCNSWANAGPNIDGLFYGVPSPGLFFTTECIWSNGYTPLACGPPTLCPPVHYTTDVDPMFVDGPNGDLRLQASSPLRDVIPLSSPNPQIPMYSIDMALTEHDVDGNPRQIDGDGPGPHAALSDVGAHEATAYRLDHAGLPKLGNTVTWTTVGSPGDAIVITGLGLTTQHIPPYGYMLAGDLASVAGVGIFPVGTPVPVTLPPIPQLVGFSFAVQALAVPYASPAHAEFTNAWQATIFP